MLVNSKQESGALDQSAQPAARVWFGVKHPDAFESTGLAIDSRVRFVRGDFVKGRSRSHRGSANAGLRFGEAIRETRSEAGRVKNWRVMSHLRDEPLGRHRRD